jgi:hypothetical protein
MTKEEKSLHTLVDSVQYDVNLFKVYIGENKYIMGYMSATPEDNNFFVYKTIYDTIIDLDEKIKKSFDLAIEWEYRSDIEKFNMVSPPSIQEKEAIYYTENAIFRTSVLWDMLAQLYNIHYKNNQHPEKVYYTTLFITKRRVSTLIPLLRMYICTYRKSKTKSIFTEKEKHGKATISTLPTTATK